jgi:hypothetical protein
MTDLRKRMLEELQRRNYSDDNPFLPAAMYKRTVLAWRIG